MGMRPQAAQWFEILTPRDQLTTALECLGESGAAELQTHSQPNAKTRLPDLGKGLKEYPELRRRYGAWWPRELPEATEATAEPLDQLNHSLASVRDWAGDVDPVIAELQHSRTRLEDLLLLSDLMDAAGERLPGMRQLSDAGPYLDSRLYLMPDDTLIEQLPPSVLIQHVEAVGNNFLLAVGESEQMEELDERLSMLRARRLVLPDNLSRDPVTCRSDIALRIGELESSIAELTQQLAAAGDRLELPLALSRLRLLEWYVHNVPELPATEQFAWITGWTSDPDGGRLESALRRRQVRYLLRLSEPPEGTVSPMVLQNPAWVRPFELFSDLLGTPAAEEVDPSRILALIAPLMFGYMFGDVGQGFVLFVAGLFLRKKIPALALLVPGGISAIAFGFVFGSIFGNEEIIPALWLHPLQHPLVILGTSLVFGVIIVTVGLALDAIQCHWRHSVLEYWGSRLGLAITYFGMISAFFLPGALWAIPIGAAWFIGGSTLATRDKGAGAAAMEYGETLLQLAVNTISFVRVGAFALAHGGLSAAVVGLADGSGSSIGALLILILGNALIIALEGLVVSIQTTRLVLFEFFTRFLRVSGRRFQPLPAPELDEHSTDRRES